VPSAGDDLIGGPGSLRRPAGQLPYRLSRQGHGDPTVLVAPFRRPSEGLGNWTHDLVVPAARHHAGRGAARALVAVEIGPLARGGYTARIQLTARATAARARRGRSSEDLEPPGSCSGTRLPAAYPATGEGPHDERFVTGGRENGRTRLGRGSRKTRWRSEGSSARPRT